MYRSIFPYRISWDITYKCNLSCSHCFIVHQEKARAAPLCLDRNQCVSIAEQIVKSGAFVLSISGGEPLLVPHLGDVLSTLSGSDIQAVVGTNGSLLTSEVIEDMKRYRNLAFQVSLDGADATVHDRLRGKGSFAAVISAIECLVNYFSVTVAVVLTNDVCERLYDICYLADELGVNGLKLQPFIDSNSVLEQGLSPAASAMSEARRQYAKFIRTRQQSQLAIAHPFDDMSDQPSNKQWECYCLASECTITPEGNLVACGATLDLAGSLGNLLETPLQDIWRNIPSSAHIDFMDSECLCQRALKNF